MNSNSEELTEAISEQNVFPTATWQTH